MPFFSKQPMLHLSMLLITLCFSQLLVAQTKTITLYDGKAPGSESWTWQAQTFKAGPPMSAMVTYNVSQPVMHYYAADKATQNGAALLILPGGAMHVLNTEYEGDRIAKTFAQKGFQCFVLNYRLVQSTTDDPWAEMMTCMRSGDAHKQHVNEISKLAVEDVQQALRLIRTAANEYNIQPQKIGVMGMSAGGGLIVRMLGENAGAKQMPDFAACLYAGIMEPNVASLLKNGPPLFIAGATDDALLPKEAMIKLYNAYTAAGNTVEMHVYASGNHGLRTYPSTTWTDRFYDWAKANKIVE